MGNLVSTYLWSTLRPCLTTLYLAFLLLHFTNTIANNVDDIILNCGSFGESTALDGRTWIGDVNSTFFPLEQSQNRASITNSTVPESPFVAELPYATARFSLSIHLRFPTHFWPKIHSTILLPSFVPQL
jgi:hypothetical protein